MSSDTILGQDVSQGSRPPLLGDRLAHLDRFEGPGYQRILVPVFSRELGPGQAGKRRLYTVANLYAATEASPGEAAF